MLRHVAFVSPAASPRVSARAGTIGAAVIILVVGFTIGGWLAVTTRGSDQRTQRVTTSSKVVRGPGTVRSTVPTAHPTVLATAVTTTPVPVHVATPAPTVPVKATSTPRATVTTAATVAPVAATAGGPVEGEWQLDQANVQVGTIVWSGSAMLAGGNTLILDARKRGVGGRAAVPCERQTSLHVSLSLGVAQQTVPYREVNCAGVTSTGEVRVTSFSGDNRTFSGTFWQSGTKLGEFEAHKQ